MDYQALNQLLCCGRQFSHQKIRKQKLSDTECMICAFIYSHPKCSQDDACNALKIDKTTLGKAMCTLEKKKCINRSRDTVDRRKKRLTLTATGKRKIVNLMGAYNEWLDALLSPLSEEEKAQFGDYCSRVLVEAEKQSQLMAKVYYVRKTPKTK